MDNYLINQSLIAGEIDRPGVLPHRDQLKTIPFVFEADFGLPLLPTEPGVIFIRGPRQYGKSTWLEEQIAITIQSFGAGSALYLNGDELLDYRDLHQQIRAVIGLFSPKTGIKRLFIDEITAVENWQKAVKRLLDAGELRDILLISTGSKASDLRRGVERLPGRKGKLDRTNYIFTPISFTAFREKCEPIFRSDTFWAYLLCGGSPVGANALAATGTLPEYVIAIATDWILGEFAASGRSRSHVLAVLQSLYRTAGTPVGQSKLARESGLANNTTAQGYIELFADLMTVVPSYPYDPDKKISIYRQPCKYHFINLLVAISFHPQKPRTIEALKHMGKDLGPLLEWLVAQEIWRQQCIIHGGDLPDHLNFWQSKEHEIDFVLPEASLYLEVKSGKTSASEFMWFAKTFKNQTLTVVSQSVFESMKTQGITFEDFLIHGICVLSHK